MRGQDLHQEQDKLARGPSWWRRTHAQMLRAAPAEKIPGVDADAKLDLCVFVLHAALLPVPGSRFPTLSQVYRTDPYSSQPESFRLADSPSNKENKSESKVPLLRVGAACISIAILPLVSE